MYIYFVLKMFKAIENRKYVKGLKIRKPNMALSLKLIIIYIYVPLHAYSACDNFVYSSFVIFI